MRVGDSKDKDDRLSGVGSRRKGRKPKKPAIFRRILDMTRRKRPEMTVEQLVEAIDRAGERLGERPFQREMEEYKELVGAFIERVSREGLSVEERVSTRLDNQKIFRIVKVVDEKLVALSRLVLSEQSDRTALVARIDEIRGLIIDLRS